MQMTVPGYSMTQRLAQGSESSVYRAVRAADEHPVILKIFEPAYPSPEKIAWFKREFDLTRGLDVPEVVKALALEKSDRRWWMVLDDCGGDSLDRVIAKPLDVTEVLELAIGMVDAIGAVHQREVVHNNICPASFVHDARAGVVKLVDFRLASVLHRESPSLRDPNALEGTLAYISPEQTGRMNRTIDYRTDFYSLGATLYALLTGAPPFDSDDPMELVHCHLAKAPTPVRERSASVPRAVSELVMKLMAKTAEGRYQSTYGIRADLEELRSLLSSGGDVESFRLGRRDVYERFQIPQKLYGREQDLENLLGAFTHAGRADTNCELMLVAGRSGIGKSVLVRELHKPVTESRGYFIAGKFDQLQRTMPHSALVSAFRSLIQQLLGEGEEQLERWRSELLHALGPNGRVITDVIPEVQLIVGPQPEVQKLGANEAENRFNLVFQRFVRVFTRPRHPIALFLDDLQWADSASLKLVELLMQDSKPQSLLIIGAFRADEVGAKHALTSSTDKLRQAGAVISRIDLDALSLGQLTQLIADTTRAEESESRSLAELVLGKTGGNPFYVGSFLDSIHQKGLLAYDREGGRWRWDDAEIRAADLTDNVVDMTIGRLGQLPEATRLLVCRAACIGSAFSLDTLAAVDQCSAGDAFEALLPSIQEGFLLATSSPEVVDERLLPREYKFAHDRVQQAAYTLSKPDERGTLHLRIGRMMLGDAGDELANRLFGILAHLNLGTELMEPTERLELAELNLQAARKAKSATAYDAACAYLRAGLGLLPDDGWERQRELALSLSRELIEVDYLRGDYEAAELLANEVMAHGLSDLEKAEVHCLLVTQFIMRARYQEALEGVRAGLALVGQTLPRNDIDAAVEASMDEVTRNLGDREIASLLTESEMSDPRARVAARLLRIGMAPAYYDGPQLYSLVILKAVNLSLIHGATPDASNMYSCFGHLLSGLHDQFQAGEAFGKLGLQMAQRFGRRDLACASSFIWANWVLPWTTHLPEALPLDEEGFQAGLDGGELTFAGYTVIYSLLYPMLLGRACDEVSREMDIHLDFLERTKNQLCIDCCMGFRLILANLAGETPHRLSFDTADMSEAAFLALGEENQSWMGLCYFHILKTQVLYLGGEPAAGLESAALAEERIANIFGNAATAYHNLYTSLCEIACCHDVDENERAERLERVRKNQARLGLWADACPENWEHMHTLVEAELARLEGEVDRAMELYDRSTEQARRHRFLPQEALANERAATLCLEMGREDEARDRWAAAHYGYGLWGASWKARELAQEHPEWVGGGKRASADTVSGLDVISVVKACQTISGEIVLEHLLDKLMAIVIENAGAQRGVLILEERSGLRVHVDALVDQDAIKDGQATGLPAHLETYPTLPRRIINTVARTRQPVLLGDAWQEGRFVLDRYLKQNKIQSVLCLPLLRQKQLLGLLYLENNLTHGAFTPERVEILSLLTTQVAISIENARLYDEMEQRVAERTLQLRQKNEDLHLRTTELKAALEEAETANQAKSTFLATMSHEIRTPINGVIGMAHLAMRAQPSDKQRGYLEKILGSTKTLLGVINDVLDVSKIEAGRLEIERTEFALEDVLEDLSSLVEQECHNKGLEFIYDDALTADR